MPARALLLVVALCGCYGPRPPIGATCDPARPRCPDGQVCASPGVCVVPGDDADGGIDGAPGDAGDPLVHVELAAGWSAAVFRDFSADHQFVAADFVDGDETYDNEPDRLFVLDAPFARVLGVVAGRQLIELALGELRVHDFGDHDPNNRALPDDITDAVLAPTFEGGPPVVLIASSSDQLGDGSFDIAADWTLADDNTENNTRAIAFDAAGAFDARPGPEAYLGTDHGIVRSSDDAKSSTGFGDVLSLKTAGGALLFVRQLSSTAREDLARITRLDAAPAEVTVLVTRDRIRLADEDPPPPYLAWAVVDDRQVALVGPAGELDVVASTSAPGFVWHSVAAPAPPHPLAGARPTVYLLEADRGRDLDRVLVLTGP